MASACCEQGLAVAPASAELHHAKGLLLIRQKHYARGGRGAGQGRRARARQRPLRLCLCGGAAGDRQAGRSAGGAGAGPPAASGRREHPHGAGQRPACSRATAKAPCATPRTSPGWRRTTRTCASCSRRSASDPDAGEPQPPNRSSWPSSRGGRNRSVRCGSWRRSKPWRRLAVLEALGDQLGERAGAAHPAAELGIVQPAVAALADQRQHVGARARAVRLEPGRPSGP